MNKQETLKILAILKTIYPRNFEGVDAKLLTDVWQDSLKDYSYQDIDKAVRAYIATNEDNRPPSIGKIRSMAVKMTQPEVGMMTAQEAASLVNKAAGDSSYNSVEQFNKLPEMIRRVVGSPQTLKEWGQLPPETFQTVILSNFQRSYMVALKQEVENAKLPDDLKYLHKVEETEKLENPVELKLVGVGKTLDELTG